MHFGPRNIVTVRDYLVYDVLCMTTVRSVQKWVEMIQRQMDIANSTFK